MIKSKDFAKNIYLAILITTLSRLSYWISGQAWNNLQNKQESIFNLLCQWDALWYRTIAEQGYMKEPMYHAKGDAANWAFSPLYPLSVKFFSMLTGLKTNYSGVIVSTVFLIIALFFVIKYVSLTRDTSHALTAAILLGLGPYSFYFASLYTESLFLLLAVLCFYCLEKEKWLLCGIFGALLTATRPTGILFVFAFLIKIFVVEFNKQKNIFKIIKDFFTNEKKLLALLLIPVGLFSYMTFLYFWVGDPFAFIHIQLAWARESANPLKLIVDGLTGKTGFYYQYLAAWAASGLICSAYLFKQKRFAEGTFGLLIIVVPLMLGNLLAIQRFFVGSFVLVLAVNDIINRFPTYKWVIITFLCTINISLLFLWFSSSRITI
jgi:Gpi18-like mannosyltransferase